MIYPSLLVFATLDRGEVAAKDLEDKVREQPSTGFQWSGSGSAGRTDSSEEDELTIKSTSSCGQSDNISGAQKALSSQEY